jgi:hypothetical protein
LLNWTLHLVQEFFEVLMKLKILFTSLALLCATSAFAEYYDFAPSPYIGFQVGHVNMDYSGSKYTTTDSVDSKKYGGRAYVGYSFTETLAGEVGYMYLGSPSFKHFTGNEQSFIQQGIDADIKVSVPLNFGLGFYVKGGGAWIHRGKMDSCSGFFVAKDSDSKVSLLAGMGATFNLAPAWGFEAFFTRMFESGSLPKTDFYGLGLILKMGM